MAVYFYQSKSGDGWRNLAADGFFLENLNKDDIMLYFYINKNAVIIGKSQNAWRECNLEAMERDGVQLVRRHTGGGAVFHDENNLNFSFIMSEDNYDLKRQMGVIQRMAARFGMTAELSGRNDILIDGKKFSGNAFAARKGMRAHHGTILVNTDLSRLANYLNVSQKKMNAKGIKSVKSRVCNLSDFNGSITVPMAAEAIKEEYAGEYGEYSEYVFSGEGLKETDRLYEKQASWEWRFGRTPEFDYQLEEKLSFGEIQLLFTVKEGRVLNVDVFSDALDTELPERLKALLAGAEFTPDALAERLLAGGDAPELKETAEYIKSVSF